MQAMLYDEKVDIECVGFRWNIASNLRFEDEAKARRR